MSALWIYWRQLCGKNRRGGLSILMAKVYLLFRRVGSGSAPASLLNSSTTAGSRGSSRITSQHIDDRTRSQIGRPGRRSTKYDVDRLILVKRHLRADRFETESDVETKHHRLEHFHSFTMKIGIKLC